MRTRVYFAAWSLLLVVSSKGAALYGIHDATAGFGHTSRFGSRSMALATDHREDNLNADDSFGTMSGARDPRIIQFALKVLF
jgi:hypothetical protein